MRSKRITSTNLIWQINREGIYEMLKLETPNLHEIGLDRVIAYGHTFVSTLLHTSITQTANIFCRWSPLHELIPNPPLRHGHAISVDMAYSATLAHLRGLLSQSEHHRLLTLFSRAGLSIDHPQFDDHVLEKGTAAILKTRDGLLRLAVPNPLGSCTFLNDVSQEEMRAALRKHKALVRGYPRQGAGIEAYCDKGDTGYEDFELLRGPVKEVRFDDSNGFAEHANDTGYANGNGYSNGNGHVDKGKGRALSDAEDYYTTGTPNGFTAFNGTATKANTPRDVSNGVGRTGAGIGNCLTSGNGDGEKKGHRAGAAAADGRNLYQNRVLG
jgi:3-dehydroquinate synthase